MATLNNVITNANGCVGIGTSSPTVKLDVVGSATISNALTVTGTTALNGAVNLSTSGTPTITLGSASSYGVLTASGTNAASIYLNGANRTGFEAELQFGAAEHQWFNGSLSSQIMTLNTTGLGIGTTSPTRKLHIDGGATTTVGIYIDANGISGTDIEQSSDAFRFQIRDNIPALFYTNNTERIRITSDGNVGIGTTSPLGKLHIYGFLRVGGAANDQTGTIALGNDTHPTGTYGDNGIFRGGIGSIGSGNYTNVSSYQGIVFNVGNAAFGSQGTKMIIDVNGNVGIGTTSPVAKLHIDDASTPYIRITRSGTPTWELRNNFPSTEYGFSINNVTAGTTILFAGQSGNVGIGTTSPVAKLHITGSSTAAVFQGNVGIGTTSFTYSTSNRGLLELYGATDSLIALRNSNNPFYIQKFSTNAYLNNTDNGAFILYTNNNERMRIAADGKVGIGTSSPNHILDIAGGTGTTFNMGNSSDSLRGGKLTFISSSATGRQFYVGTTSAIYNLVFGIDSVEKARIDTSGNLGINTTSPSAKLHVSASASTTAGIFQGVVGIGLTPTSAVPRLQIYGTSTSNAESRLAIYTSNTGTAYNNGLQLAVASDSVTSLINCSNTALYFGTNSTERMRITSTGDVGIGTTSPTAALDISRLEYPSLGGILASFTAGTTTPTTEKYVYLKQTYTGAAYDSPMLAFRANANSVNSGSFGTVRTTSNGSIVFSNVNSTSGTVTAVSEKMRIDANGNVGIGTTVIRSKLEIAGNTSSPPIASVQWTPTARSGSFGIDGTGVYIRNSSNGDYFDLKNASGVARFRVIYDNATHLTTNFVSIGNLSQTGSKLSVFGNTSIGSSYGSVAAPSNGLIVQGSVGIGTTAPSGSLTIQTNGTQLRLQTASGPSAYYSTINSLYDSTHPFSIAVAGNSLTTAEYFGIYADSGGSNPRIALLNGNVGIGTTTPFGTAANRTVLSVNGTTDVSLNIGSGGSQRAYFYGVSTYAELGTIGSLPLTFAPNNSEKMRLNVDGNVGIGTTAPAYKLEVNGSLYATRLSGSAMFTTNGKGRFYGTASYALAAPGGGSSLTGQTDSVTPFETSLGHQAGNSNTGTGNTAIGYQALFSNTTGTGSIALGYQALYSNTRGKRNIAIGYEALRTTQGSTDVYGDPIGDENVAIGYQAARAAFNINRVVAIGHRALAKNLAGGNVAIGWLAMESNVGTANSNSGVLNTAVGTMALSSNTSGNANSAFGYLALNSNTTGYENTAVGHRSMVYNTTGKNNCSFGSYALYYNQIANNNSAFGNFALYNNTAKNNSAFGYKALRFNTTGVNNCAFGSGSLYNNTSGTKNTTVGGNAGSTITTGTNLSVFGYNAQASTATATNEVTLGNSSVATLRCQVTTITALSDFRDKTDINNVEVGLSFVEKLRPVTFKWDKREWYTDGNRDGSKKDTITQIGFIAQELKALQESENATYLNLVYESNPDKLEATPGNLMIPLIKAVQELNAIVKQQRIEFDDKIAKQQLEIDYLKSKLNN